MTRQIHWVSQSSDKKIGKVMASYSPIESCPDSCSLKTGGCYAWGLFYLRNLGKKIAKGDLNKSLDEAFSKMKSTSHLYCVYGFVVGPSIKKIFKHPQDHGVMGRYLILHKFVKQLLLGMHSVQVVLVHVKPLFCTCSLAVSVFFQ